MESSQRALQLWLRWVIASTLGLVLGYLIANAITTAGQQSYGILSAALGGAAFGLCLASLQTLIIGPYMKLGHWIIASVVGYSLGMVFMQLGNDLLQFSTWAKEQDRTLLYFTINAASISLVIGLPVGLMQWWNFRHRGVSILAWVLASIVAIGVSIFVSMLVARMVNTDQTVSGLELVAILFPLVLIFSTVTWIPVFQSGETSMPHRETTDTPTINLEDTNSVEK